MEIEVLYSIYAGFLQFFIDLMTVIRTDFDTLLSAFVNSVFGFELPNITFLDFSLYDIIVTPNTLTMILCVIIVATIFGNLARLINPFD